jgi:hypothetical protein
VFPTPISAYRGALATLARLEGACAVLIDALTHATSTEVHALCEELVAEIVSPSRAGRVTSRRR